MEHSGVSKFTRLLPISIRKEVGSGSVFQHGSGSGNGDRTFNREPTNGSSDFFREQFDHGNDNMSSPQSSRGGGGMEQKEVVRVTVTYPSPAVGAMNPHKEISLRITNDENPTFFYHLRVTETDYPMIKSQQGLLVDFYGFPNQLITLLEKCDPCAASDNDDSRSNAFNSGPKFIMVMKVGINSVLDLVESNPFKYLCHLSLQINPGTDSEVKKYLADVTNIMKKEKALLEEKFKHVSSASETEIVNLKKALAQKEEEIRQMRDDLHAQASSLSSKHFQDMTTEKEKLLKMQSDLAAKFEMERQEIDRRHSMAVTSFENRIASLEAENRDLIQNKFKNETALQNAQSKIKNAEADLKLLQQELTSGRKQTEKLDKDYHEKQKLVNSLQNRLSLVETDLKEKQSTVQRQQEYIQQLSEQKKLLEDHTTNMVREVDRLKSANQSSAMELAKANEIIRKLQDDIRSLHAKTKLKNQIAQEQEKRLGEQEKQKQQLEDAVGKLTSKLASLEENESKAADELQESKTKIETLENTIKANENMISWLNKQLNQFQGLGKLNLLRGNLANAAQGAIGGAGQVGGRTVLQETSGQINGSTGVQPGSLPRAGRLFPNIQNTLPNDSPSWMNIYQSTSTPLDNDLTSRFERISANNNNYSVGRSRLDAISHREVFIDESTGDKGEENKNPAGDSIPRQGTSNPVNKNANTRPPTWAKPRSGKVTLEGSAQSRPNGNLIRRNN